MSATWIAGHHHKALQETSHFVACSFSKKAPKPLNPNLTTVQSKVMMLRYSLGDSSMSHPQPNLRYSTVGLPLHPRGCLLRACEAQWTEFQWADSFFCLSVRTYRVHRRSSTLHEYTVTIWHKQKCWDASFLRSSSSISLFHSLTTVCSLYFPCSVFVPLSPCLSVGSFPFSAILSSLQRRVPCTNRMTGQL